VNLILEIVGTPKYSVFTKSMNFNENGGKIGRNKHMDWVLNDPTKYISNFHAEITFEHNQYYITDKSSNGTSFKEDNKKLTKGMPVPLTQSNRILIGEYEISVQIVSNEFIGTPENKSSEGLAIPDQFFMGNDSKNAFDVINPDKGSNDIMSLLGDDPLTENENILPELNTILGDTPHQEVENRHSALNSYVNDSEFRQEEKIESPAPEPIVEEKIIQSHSDESLFNLLAVKLGLDTDKMQYKDKEKVMSEIADFLRITIEQSQTTLQSLNIIQSQLGVVSEKEFGPFKDNVSVSSVFSDINAYQNSPAFYVKQLFSEINSHNVAFLTTHHKISLDTAMKFSPKKLYISFEQEDKLSKVLSNKKSLAWDAYAEKFKNLDTMQEIEDVDVEKLKKEYMATLRTIRLGQ